jgi:catechol 2,3-dioxygenase-like lactoylglutathione lyase family enzyme
MLCRRRGIEVYKPDVRHKLDSDMTNRLHLDDCSLDAALVSSRNKRDNKMVAKSKLLRVDNILIVVDDLEAAKAFFTELGMELEGETTVDGPLVGNLIGLKDVRATLAMMRSPDGGCGIELDKFHTPSPVRFGPVDAPVNTLGLRRIMFLVDGIDDVVARLKAQGAELIGEMQYEDSYRLAYIRGPEGIIVALSEQIGNNS